MFNFYSKKNRRIVTIVLVVFLVLAMVLPMVLSYL
ncbi:MAG: synaptobrevin-B [Lachnospiraceae bacterium]